MILFFSTLYIFLDLIYYILFLDIILSWISLSGIQFRPRFISSIMDPIYNFIKKSIPTTFWIIDVTPIIVLLGIFFLKGLIVLVYPDIQTFLFNISL